MFLQNCKNGRCYIFFEIQEKDEYLIWESPNPYYDDMDCAIKVTCDNAKSVVYRFERWVVGKFKIRLGSDKVFANFQEQHDF